jgi:hypothetical protein
MCRFSIHGNRGMPLQIGMDGSASQRAIAAGTNTAAIVTVDQHMDPGGGESQGEDESHCDAHSHLPCS